MHACTDRSLGCTQVSTAPVKSGRRRQSGRRHIFQYRQPGRHSNAEPLDPPPHQSVSLNEIRRSPRPAVMSSSFQPASLALRLTLTSFASLRHSSMNPNGPESALRCSNQLLRSVSCGKIDNTIIFLIFLYICLRDRDRARQ